jgi:hypothetical protein
MSKLLDLVDQELQAMNVDNLELDEGQGSNKIDSGIIEDLNCRMHVGKNRR